jgi:hypothetical protein
LALRLSRSTANQYGFMISVNTKLGDERRDPETLEARSEPRLV